MEVSQYLLQNVSGHLLWVNYTLNGQLYAKAVPDGELVEFEAESLSSGTLHYLSLGHLVQTAQSATVFKRIESGSTLVYYGPYRPVTRYPRGAIVFFNGSTYVCNEIFLYDQTPLETGGWVPFSSNSGNGDHLTRTDNPHAVTAAQTGAVPLTAVGVADGVAPLDADGFLPLELLPPLPPVSSLASGTAQYVQAAELRTHLDARNNPHNVTAAQVSAVSLSSVGAAYGVAPLGGDGKVPSSFLPSVSSSSTFSLRTVDALDERNALALSLTSGSHVHTVATGQTWRYNGTSFTDVSPTSGWVFSVNGRKGPGISLETVDIPESEGFNYFTDVRLSSSPVFQAVALLSHEAGSDVRLAEGTEYEVTALDLRNHMDDRDNPHGITAGQIGALSSLHGDTSPSLSTALDAASFRIVNMGDPVEDQDAATKAYVDAASSTFSAVINGIAIHLGSNVVLPINANTVSGILTDAVTVSALTRVGTLDFLTVAGAVTANSLAKAGGTSSQFLKADGSVDSTDYLSPDDVIDGGTFN